MSAFVGGAGSSDEAIQDLCHAGVEEYEGGEGTFVTIFLHVTCTYILIGLITYLG